MKAQIEISSGTMTLILRPEYRAEERIIEDFKNERLKATADYETDYQYQRETFKNHKIVIRVIEDKEVNG